MTFGKFTNGWSRDVVILMSSFQKRSCDFKWHHIYVTFVNLPVDDHVMCFGRHQHFWRDHVIESGIWGVQSRAKWQGFFVMSLSQAHIVWPSNMHFLWWDHVLNKNVTCPFNILVHLRDSKEDHVTTVQISRRSYGNTFGNHMTKKLPKKLGKYSHRSWHLGVFGNHWGWAILAKHDTKSHSDNAWQCVEYFEVLSCILEAIMDHNSIQWHIVL